MKSLGIERMRAEVESEWQASRASAPLLCASEVERVPRTCFRPQPYQRLTDVDPTSGREPAFKAWYRYNTRAHRVAGYRAVFVSLKAHGEAPGDMTSAQMAAVADLAERVNGLIRVTHSQNLLLADVRQRDLHEVWRELASLKLAMPNIGTLTDMIACPGLDFCSLANAGTLDVARDIQQRFDDLDYLYDLGELEIKMSGCMNACGHHHVGHIGVLGVDKHGEEWYQISLGGIRQRLYRPGRGDRTFGAQERGGRDHRTYRARLSRAARRRRTLHQIQQGGACGAPFKERAYAQHPQAA